MTALAPVSPPRQPGPSVRRQEIYRRYAQGEVSLEDAAKRASEVSLQREEAERGAIFLGLLVTALLLIAFGKNN
jgi:hypothetical protein